MYDDSDLRVASRELFAFAIFVLTLFVPKGVAKKLGFSPVIYPCPVRIVYLVQ